MQQSQSRDKRKRLKRYYVHQPGMIYAMDFYATGAEDAKRQLRAWLGVKRLRSGSAAWVAQ